MTLLIAAPATKKASSMLKEDALNKDESDAYEPTRPFGSPDQRVPGILFEP